jgi:hypothetical protein
MNAHFARRRWGGCTRESTVMLALIIVVCIAALRLAVPEQQPDPRPLSDRILAAALGLAQCFGLFVGASILLASVELAKQSAARYRQRRVEKKLARLRPVLRDANGLASPDHLKRVLRLLGDADPGVRQHALGAAYCLLRGNATLAPVAATGRAALERALLLEPGFARTLQESAGQTPLPELVTLGAKIGAGSAEKRIAPVTSDPAVLARWIGDHRDPRKQQELQVSIGYDTGTLPFLAERAKFLALFLYVASTDLKRFQALTRRPARDPNAAFGLLIRGDVVEVRYPGQARGRRLDYVFPLPARLTTASLTGFLRQFQLLNLGLLLAAVDDACRALVPAEPPAWFDARLRAASRVYRRFERRLVALLRQHDRYREPALIHPLVSADHGERVRAFRTYRLEECLYPQYAWVVPLYGTDSSWDRLLPPLRTVEGMLLHQGEVEDSTVTRGLDFIHKMRLLGYQTATALEEVLAAAEPTAVEVPPDPFIDAGDEEATTHYLRRVSRALWAAEASPEDLPEPATFRKAADYYEIEPGGGVLTDGTPTH